MAIGNSFAAVNKQLKTGLAERRAILVPGASNALTARLIEDLGYEAVYVSGAGVSNMQLGVPDVGLITQTDLLGAVASIRDSVTLPLIVDADTGFGNAVNAYRAVRLLERAGASAIQIEDQVFPKRCGHFAGKDVIPSEEMVQKIKAAADARHDSNLQIIARTDAYATHGLSAAIDRASRYVEAGADVTFVEAPTTTQDLGQIASSLRVPQIVNLVIGGKTPLHSHAEFKELGFAMVLYANVALQAALAGMRDVLSELRITGTIRQNDSRILSFEERQRLVRKDIYDALERKYS